MNIKNIDNFETNSIVARISWRPISMSTKKYLYTLSWSSKGCEEESKQLRAQTRVSIIYLTLEQTINNINYKYDFMTILIKLQQ